MLRSDREEPRQLTKTSQMGGTLINNKSKVKMDFVNIILLFKRVKENKNLLGQAFCRLTDFQTSCSGRYTEQHQKCTEIRCSIVSMARICFETAITGDF